MVGAPYRVCFVCTGNICRSPMAEVVFRSCVERAGLGERVRVESAGTGPWHVDEPMMPYAADVLARHRYDGSGHQARMVDPSWLEDVDLVVAMTPEHERQVRHAVRGRPIDVRLLRSFDPAAGDDLDVPDPYWGTEPDYEHVLTLVEAACPGLLDAVRHKL